MAPMGGAPGRRDSNAVGQSMQIKSGNMINYQNANNDLLNSSSITDKKMNRYVNEQSSIISRSSALQTMNRSNMGQPG